MAHSAIQLRMDSDPLTDTTINLFVSSDETKPWTSVRSPLLKCQSNCLIGTRRANVATGLLEGCYHLRAGGSNIGTNIFGASDYGTDGSFAITVAGSGILSKEFNVVEIRISYRD